MYSCGTVITGPMDFGIVGGISKEVYKNKIQEHLTEINNASVTVSEGNKTNFDAPFFGFYVAASHYLTDSLYFRAFLDAISYEGDEKYSYHLTSNPNSISYSWRDDYSFGYGFNLGYSLDLFFLKMSPYTIIKFESYVDESGLAGENFAKDISGPGFMFLYGVGAKIDIPFFGKYSLVFDGNYVMGNTKYSEISNIVITAGLSYTLNNYKK